MLVTTLIAMERLQLSLLNLLPMSLVEMFDDIYYCNFNPFNVSSDPRPCAHLPSIFKRILILFVALITITDK